MSQGFKLKFDEMRDNDPTKDEPAQYRERAFDKSYPDEGHARSICFVWPDGRRMFLNYSFLVSGEYLPDESNIVLTFTSNTFVLKGVNLEGLFYDIIRQQAKQVTCIDARYNVVGDGEKFIVNEIEMKM